MWYNNTENSRVHDVFPHSTNTPNPPPPPLPPTLAFQIFCKVRHSPTHSLKIQHCEIAMHYYQDF